MNSNYDLVIVGAGFGGSLMAMVARRLGLSVLLLEQGSHPRVVIGESTTPLSNLLLEKLGTTYNLPRLAPLARWDSWQRAYPQLGCGLKRGFTFFNAEGCDPLLVAASPHDAIADTHWYRADVDDFLVKEAQSLGVGYHDHVHIAAVQCNDDGATLLGRAGNEALAVRARFLVDATGPRGFLHRNLQLAELDFPGLPATESLYNHFTGVGRTPPSADTPPFAVDDAAVHHVFDGGWVWVLRFNNGVTSAGVAATKAAAAALNLSEGEPAWQRLLDRLPALKAQFTRAKACQPFRYLPRVSFRSRTLVGKRWAMLPSAAGFVDPLFSTGFSLTLLGIERLARVLTSPDVDATLQTYAQQTESDLLAASQLIAAMYATMGNFEAFKAVSMLYFAAVSFAETAYRLGKPELAQGFLLHAHPTFGPAARDLLASAGNSVGLTAKVRPLIEPFNLGEFGKPARGNSYPVRAEDLLSAAHKLGATRDEIAAMLQNSGFYKAEGTSGMSETANEQFKTIGFS